ncbi:MAG TPA: DUF4384 domain-containing protein [Acidobacteriota bacterium]|nr:DUF4384 domain-containing protein [Acidobacteriota bacterium]
MNLREISSICCFLTMLLALQAGPAAGQAPGKLSAREIFYSPPVEPPAAKKEPAAQAKKPKEQKPVETASSKPAVAKPAPAPGRPADSTGVQMIPAAYSTEDSVALGLRYSILKREGSETTEVKPDTVFHSGDRIRLRVDVNTQGFLYIINRGSSGNWNPLFPSSKIAKGDNRVQKGTQYEIPAGYVFTFDEQPGTEKLFIVFSRRPVSDLEELIYNLTGKQDLKTSPRPDDGKILLAQAKIEDKMVDRFRTVYSRDLIIEKVDEATPPPPSAPSKDNAVYVVNPSKSADARVVADVTLIHK